MGGVTARRSRNGARATFTIGRDAASRKRSALSAAALKAVATLRFAPPAAASCKPPHSRAPTSNHRNAVKRRRYRSLVLRDGARAKSSLVYHDQACSGELGRGFAHRSGAGFVAILPNQPRAGHQVANGHEPTWTRYSTAAARAKRFLAKRARQLGVCLQLWHEKP